MSYWALIASKKSHSHVFLDSVVEDKNKSSSSSSNDVGRSSLEESLSSSFSIKLSETVHSSRIENISSSRLHHQPTSDSVEGIGGKSSNNGNNLGKWPLLIDRSISVISEKNFFSCVEESKVWCSVSKDTSNRDSKTSI